MSPTLSSTTRRARRAAVSLLAIGGLVIGAGSATFAVAHGHAHHSPDAATTSAHAVHPARTAPARTVPGHAAAARPGSSAARSGATTSAHAAGGRAAARMLLAGSYHASSSHLTPGSQRKSLKNKSLPRVKGVAVVGGHLRSTTGSWAPSKHLTFKYQWFTNGLAIKRANKATYDPSVKSVGKVTVQVTAVDQTKKYRSTTVSSAPVKVQLPKILSTRAPKIIGGKKPAVGTALSVTPGSWSVRRPTLTFQWVDVDTHRAIKGATKASFVPGRKQIGDRLAVVVTAAATNFRSLTVTTGSTGKVVR